MRKRPVTLKDVAEKAGVSATTVSMVLRGKADRYGIAAATAERVTRMADELGFVPNRLASSFSTGRSRMIGIMPSNPEGLFDTWYGPRILKGCVAEANRRNYHLMLMDQSPAWREIPPNTFANELVGGRIDGLLVIEEGLQTGLEPYVEVAETMPMAVSSIAVQGMPRLANGTGVDYGQMARIAVEHLAKLGHKNIGLILQNRYLLEVQTLIESFNQELKARGGSLPPERIMEDRPGRNGLVDTIRSGSITAAMVLFDGEAARICRELAESGLRVPNDFSLIGLGDFPLSENIWPPLTTIRPPMDELAARATRHLLDQIEGKKGAENGSVQLPAELVLRASTGLAPGITL